MQEGILPGHPLFQFAILPGAFAPAFACIVVRKWVTREGFSDAGLHPNLKKWRYYLVGWILPLAVTVIIIVLAVVLKISNPDFTLQRALQTQIPPLPTGFFLVAVAGQLFTALMFTPVLWGEEFGWRGYLQIRLFSDRPVLAAIATGLIWGVWHYPLNLRGYNFPENPVLGLVVFPVSTILLSIVFGWLRLKTDSVWSASLAHAATNTVGGSLTVLLFIGGPNWIFVSYTGILAWMPLGVLCGWIILTGQLTPHNLENPQQ